MRLIYILLTAALLFSACSGKKEKNGILNEKASLPAAFNFTKLGVKVVTSGINHKKGLMYTLYGKPGLVALVTWGQQDDPGWYGAKIPGDLQSVELVKITAGTEKITYQRFEGKNLVLKPDTLYQKDRIKFILAQKPSLMP